MTNSQYFASLRTVKAAENRESALATLTALRAEHDRRTVAQIADASDGSSDADERDPELVAARVQGRAEQHALKSRLAVRRYMR